jgi:hypothetical protein
LARRIISCAISNTAVPLAGLAIAHLAKSTRRRYIALLKWKQNCLESEAFAPPKNQVEFERVRNGKYFAEWDCGADLSADTIEALWATVADIRHGVRADARKIPGG